AYQSSATNWAKGNTAQGMSGLFAADDYYTTPGSSAADLPTFVGNHDMGRIANLLAGSDRLAERTAFAHETMLLTRGQPVIYYGDEQGFVGDGNDKDARQAMFASQGPSRLRAGQAPGRRRPAGDLLRRRAGLRGRRQRHGRPPVDVRQPGALLPRRRPDRRHALRRRRPLLDRRPAVPADQRARAAAQQHP